MKITPDELSQKVLDLCESEGFALASLEVLSENGRHTYSAVHSLQMDKPVPKADLHLKC